MPLSEQDALLVRLDQQLCFKLYAASRLMIKAYKPMLEALDITYPQYLVLMVLWEAEEAVTVGELGQRLLLDSGTLTPLLKRMADNGLVERQRGKEDERQVWIALSQRGRSMQEHAVDWVKSAVGQLEAPVLDPVLLRKQLTGLIELLSV